MLSLLGEPPRSQYDLRFHLWRIPVRVSPVFWLAALLIGLPFGGAELIAFVFAAFVSIVVHEMGHALVMRRFGEDPRIVLTMTGGLAIADRPAYLPEPTAGRSAKQQILISLAGPFAGFALAGLIFGIAAVGGAHFIYHPPLFVQASFPIDAAAANARSLEFLSKVVTIFLLVNILWGVINLLPVYPLDGGQVAREVLMLGNAQAGMIRSLWLSVFVGGAVAVIGIASNLFFVGLMFGLLAYNNYQTIARLRGGFGGGGGYGGYGGGGYGGGGYGGGGYGDDRGRPW